MIDLSEWDRQVAEDNAARGVESRKPHAATVYSTTSEQPPTELEAAPAPAPASTPDPSPTDPDATAAKPDQAEEPPTTRGAIIEGMPATSQPLPAPDQTPADATAPETAPETDPEPPTEPVVPTPPKRARKAAKKKTTKPTTTE